MQAIKRSLLKPYIQFAALLLLAFSAFQLYAAVALNAFTGDCSPKTVAAHGDCVVYLDPAATATTAAVVLTICVLILGFYITHRRWWAYVSVPLAIPIATIIFLTARTCNTICGPSGPNDLGGCSAVRICAINPVSYLAWLIPVAAFGLAGYTLWRSHTKMK